MFSLCFSHPGVYSQWPWAAFGEAAAGERTIWGRSHALAHSNRNERNRLLAAAAAAAAVASRARSRAVVQTSAALRRPREAGARWRCCYRLLSAPTGKMEPGERVCISHTDGRVPSSARRRAPRRDRFSATVCLPSSGLSHRDEITVTTKALLLVLHFLTNFHLLLFVFFVFCLFCLFLDFFF